jgi:hypothetical protein
VALGDRGTVPLRAVLLFEQQQPAGVVGAGGAAGVAEHHQRQQPADLPLVGHEDTQHAGQVKGALDQVGPHQP